MGKSTESLYVEIFDWPDRFLVECDGPDIDYPRFYSGDTHPDYYPDAPYLVDLSEYEDGWCGCRDFAVNVQPYLCSVPDKSNAHRTVCKHILAAKRFLLKHNYQRPQKLPTEIILT